MRVGARLRAGYVAAGVLAMGAGAAPRVAAQGGGGLAHWVGHAPNVSPAASQVGPARSVLRALVGSWRFEIRFAGNFDGAPDASGTRVVKPLFDEMRLQWTEDLDHSDAQDQGIIGFDPRSERFFASAVYSATAAPEFMTGTLDAAEPLVTFQAIGAVESDSTLGPQPPQALALNLVDQDHFTLAPLDRGWRAVFTRQP